MEFHKKSRQFRASGRLVTAAEWKQQGAENFDNQFVINDVSWDVILGSWREPVESLEGKRALDDPEHGDGTDGVAPLPLFPASGPIQWLFQGLPQKANPCYEAGQEEV